MGVALTRRGDARIADSIRREFEAHFRAKDERELWVRAEAKERECRAALAVLWRYEAGPLASLCPNQRFTVREAALWLGLRGERARLNRAGANAHEWINIHRRIIAWSSRVLRRWVRLCCRRVNENPRLVEIGGVQVNPLSKDAP